MAKTPRDDDHEPDDPDDYGAPATFHTFLEEFAHGAVNRRLTSRLSELVLACNQTGEKGSLTVKINVQAKGGMAQVSIGVKTSKPEGALPADMFFPDEEGRLHTENPRQRKLPLKSVAPSRVINLKPPTDDEEKH
jgi:hypothetical protein